MYFKFAVNDVLDLPNSINNDFYDILPKINTTFPYRIVVPVEYIKKGDAYIAIRETGKY